jgi:hypothetical protein
MVGEANVGTEVEFLTDDKALMDSSPLASADAASDR